LTAELEGRPTSALAALAALALTASLVSTLTSTPASSSPSGQAGAAEVVTRIDLVRSGGRPAAGVPIDEVVVAWTARGASGRQKASVRSDEEYELVTRGKAFRPDSIMVPLGSRVRFPNEDPILHNVFSVSEGNEFDLGLYQRGEGQTVAFESAGLVRVFCNVHHDMFAHVLVIDTPILGRVSRDGTVVLPGLPQGPGTLTVWHPRADLSTFELANPSSIPAVIELEVGRRQVPPHNNKFAKPYRAARRYDG